MGDLIKLDAVVSLYVYTNRVIGVRYWRLFRLCPFPGIFLCGKPALHPLFLCRFDWDFSRPGNPPFAAHLERKTALQRPGITGADLRLPGRTIGLAALPPAAGATPWPCADLFPLWTIQRACCGRHDLALSRTTLQTPLDVVSVRTVRFVSGLWISFFLPGLFDFPKDMAPVEAEVNRLNNQVLVQYYKGFRLLQKKERSP